MCGSKKTTEKKTFTQTTTPNNPSWVEPQIQGLTGKVADLAGQDPSQFVAPINGLLQQAGQAAGNLAPNDQAYGSALGLFQALGNTGAQTYTPATVKPNSILPNLQAYMSPYNEQVVDAALADFNHAAGEAQAQAKLARATSDTFGGSGGDIQTSSLLGNLARGYGTLSGTLRDQGFGVGANLANLDADRRQQAQLANMAAYNQAGQFNANSIEQALARQGQSGRDLVNAANAQQTAGTNAATTQANIGSILQQLQQQQASAPLSVLGQLSGMYSGLSGPLGLLHGETTSGESTSKTKESSGIGGALATLGSLAMGLGTGGLGFGLSGGLLGQLGTGSLAGLSGIGAGLNLSPMQALTAA